MPDAADRRLLGGIVAIAVIAATLILFAAGILGLAWRVLLLAAGG